MENFLSAELVCRSCGSKKEKNVPCSCMSHELNRPNPSSPITVTRNSIGSVSGDITPPGLPTKTRLHSDAHSSQATTPSAAVLANKRMSISPYRRVTRRTTLETPVGSIHKVNLTSQRTLFDDREEFEPDDVLGELDTTPGTPIATPQSRQSAILSYDDDTHHGHLLRRYLVVCLHLELEVCSLSEFECVHWVLLY